MLRFRAGEFGLSVKGVGFRGLGSFRWRFKIELGVSEGRVECEDSG